MSNENYRAETRPTAGFIEYLHRHGGSTLFLTGIILFTVGTALTSIITFSFLSILSMALVALPIIGFWLMYAASKNPSEPEKTLPALTLFKVHTIITLVLVCIGAGLVTIVGIILTVAFGAEFGGGIAVATLIGFLVVAGIFALFIVFYFVAILKILKDIRRNIIENVFKPIRGVTSFTIFTFVMIGLGFIGILIGFVALGFATSIIDELIWYAPEFAMLDTVIYGAMAVNAISVISSLVTSIGTVICVIALNKFASGMPRE